MPKIANKNLEILLDKESEIFLKILTELQKLPNFGSICTCPLDSDHSGYQYIGNPFEDDIEYGKESMHPVVKTNCLVCGGTITPELDVSYP